MNLCQSRTFKKWHERKAFMPLAQKSGMRYPINTTNTAKSRKDTMLNIKPDFEILLRYPFLKDTTAKTQAKTVKTAEVKIKANR